MKAPFITRSADFSGCRKRAGFRYFRQLRARSGGCPSVCRNRARGSDCISICAKRARGGESRIICLLTAQQLKEPRILLAIFTKNDLMETVKYPAGATAVYRYEASGTVKAVILLVHGLGEHAGRFSSWAAMFNEQGITVRAFDLPGHGRSEGRRGVIPSLEMVYETITLMLAGLASEYPGVPLFLYGHSLGGGIVLSYLVRKRPEVTGAIVTSPWIYLSETPPKAKLMLAKVMKKLMPGLTQPSGLKTEYLSREPGVEGRYNDDELVHGLISVGLYTSMTEAAAETVSRAAEISVPLLLAHGRDDMLTSPAGSVRVAEAAPKATLKLWDGGYHELHNDTVREDHFDFIIEWLDTLI